MRGLNTVHLYTIRLWIIYLDYVYTSLGVAELTSLDARQLVKKASYRMSFADSGLGTASAASVTTAEETHSNEVS